jgi:hypothetical protein
MPICNNCFAMQQQVSDEGRDLSRARTEVRPPSVYDPGLVARLVPRLPRLRYYQLLFRA